MENLSNKIDSSLDGLILDGHQKASKFQTNFTDVFFKRQWVQVLTLIAFGCIVYFPVFSHDFQSFWDDQWVVVNHYTEDGLEVKNLWSILSEFYKGQYAPVNQLYYSSLYQLFDYNPFVFHTISLLLHVSNGILVYFLVGRLLSIQGIQDFSTKLYTPLSFFAALIFIVHPVSVESVAWISASKILLYALFYFLGLIMYTFYIKKATAVCYLLTLGLFVLSFGGKEQAVTFPICLFLIDWLAERNFRDYKLYLEKLPFLLLAIFFGFVTLWSQSAVDQGMLSGNVQYPIYQRLVFACFAFTEYATKAFLPIKLSYIYPFPNQMFESLPLRFWFYPLVCIAVLWTFIKNFKRIWPTFLIAFFTLHIAITLHIIPISRFTITADRYAYISLLPVCAIISYLFIKYFKRFKIPALIIFFLYFGSLCIYTHQRSKVWRNTKTLKAEINEIIKSRGDYELLKKRIKH